MSRVTVELEGGDRLIRMAQAATNPTTLTALKQAVYGTAEAVLRDSKKLVPVDTAALKTSGRVENLEVSTQGVSVEITYGGPAIQYAKIVHDDVSMDHSPSLLTAITKRPRRGQALYLKTPVDAWKGRFVKSVVGRYSKYLKSVK